MAGIGISKEEAAAMRKVVANDEQERAVRT